MLSKVYPLVLRGAVLFCLCRLLGPPAAGQPATESGPAGVAVAIIVDTSGSMGQPVTDAAGQATAKYLVANRALGAVVDRLQAYVAGGADGAPRPLEAGLFVFHPNGQRGKEAVRFGPFDPEALRAWAKDFAKPRGNTPLGATVQVAGERVLNSPMARKHVLVITDGLNTAGPPPEAAMAALKAKADGKQAIISFHFIAFDVDAAQFGSAKGLGATVVGAADEPQLNRQLEFILQEKILLEDEDPPPANPPPATETP